MIKTVRGQNNIIEMSYILGTDSKMKLHKSSIPIQNTANIDIQILQNFTDKYKSTLLQKFRITPKAIIYILYICTFPHEKAEQVSDV